MADEQQKKTHVIMVGNQKGGVAKTTNTINLAGALVERGKKVLIIDLDATSGATKALGAPTSGWHSSYDLLTGGAPPIDCIIRFDDEEVKLPPGIDLIPGSKQLVDLEEWLRRRENKWVIHQDILLKPIEQLRGTYDFIFLDTPPQITTTTLPAMKASDFIILSTMPETASTDQLADALQDVKTCATGPNPQLKLLGIIISAMPRPLTVLARQLNDFVGKACVDAKGRSYRFNTTISRTTTIQEARAVRTTVLAYQGDSRVSDEYRELAKEVLARIETFAVEGEGTPTEPSSHTSAEAEA